MDMFNENEVLCASSAYEKKFYLNENFDRLPEDIKKELKIMCVLFTEEVGVPETHASYSPCKELRAQRICDTPCTDS